MDGKNKGVIMYLLCKKILRGGGLAVFYLDGDWYQCQLVFKTLKDLAAELLDINGFFVAEVKFQHSNLHFDNKNPYEFIRWHSLP